MNIIHIKYTEPDRNEDDTRSDVDTYEAVYVRDTATDTTQTWATGDVVKDWADMKAYMEGRDGCYSSDVDHFVMDIAGYEWTKDDMIVRI